MFAKIIVPLDGTSEGAVALSPARTLAKASSAAVILLSVIDADASTADSANTEALLEAARAELSADGLHADKLVRRGKPTAEILSATLECGADLVAMATHGRSGIARAVLGSVAQRLLRSRMGRRGAG